MQTKEELCDSFVLEGISASPDDYSESALSQARRKLTRAGLRPSAFSLELFRKSIDARKKNDIKIVCSVLCVPTDAAASRDVTAEMLARLNAKPYRAGKISDEVGDQTLSAPPLIVGMGPCGLFCAYVLAKAGFSPVLIDRGDNVENRVRAVSRFEKSGILDTESNIQFGAGGAGTFSDGKLLTRISDPHCAYVLETFVKMGAPDDVLRSARPHIGTDVLRTVVSRMLDEIVALGGQVRFRCRMDGFDRLPDGGYRVRTTEGDLLCGVLVLAPGHSSRDTYRMLIEKNLAVEPKPISVGVRIEHRRTYVDRLFYGDMAGHPALGSAEYQLSDTKGERGVYTFCMCPGGQVVAAASEPERLVVNGMSNRRRDGENSNAAIAVSVGVGDFTPSDGNLALGAIEYQRRIESAAYLAGGGDYYAPVETVGDFLNGDKPIHVPTDVRPSYRGGDYCRPASLSSVFPEYVCRSLSYGLRSFDAKCHGYAAPGAVLTCAETRTSAPVRIMRQADYCAPGYPGLYPCGEGAGYAGGITSAAVDGIRVAEAVCRCYHPN